MVVIAPERLSELDELHLDGGAHGTFEEGHCALEVVAWLAGEEHSDHPKCASPVIGAFMRRWNDDLDDEGRQRLKPYLPRLVGSKATKKIEERRAWMAADWLVRVHTPAWLELAGITESAEALRSLPELRTLTGLKKSRPKIDAARAAAWDAAGAAAWAAARDAAGDAAGAAARDAAWEKLNPTKTELQASAFELLDRMIEAGD